MDWYNALKLVFVIGNIYACIVGIVYWILFYSVLKNPKYDDKLVEVLPLLKYLKIITVCLILCISFSIGGFVLSFFE
ncbi:MAG: hypothetical protein GYA50_02170 [Eubacteriaceae bacterium]|nr:hypothetical protein [Eubacteriaceae bacterium]